MKLSLATTRLISIVSQPIKAVVLVIVFVAVVVVVVIVVVVCRCWG